VLVVDDEADTRELIAEVLKEVGSEVILCRSVGEALIALEQHKPDILISDLGMPDEDGYSLISKIRALPSEQGGHIPAAALTAYARAEDRMRVLRSGFQFHLPKPVDSAELVTVVASLAGRAYNSQS
jgi:CheY-like chemotaxis protein